MREKLIQYVELLFAGVQDCEEMKQEILLNTLDRYDDLIAGGKVPEAAYRLAIGGIGDISEILGSTGVPTVPAAPAGAAGAEGGGGLKKWLRAAAIGLYILCPVPLFVLSELGMDTIGLCGTLAIVALATVLMVLTGKKQQEQTEQKKEAKEEKSPLAKSISGLVWAVGLAVYFLVSFATNAWYITWVIFPILGALDQILGIWAAAKDPYAEISEKETEGSLRKAVSGILWAIGLAIYFLVSFATNAWFATWILFPLIGAVQGLVRAVWDLKEAISHEN